MDEQDGLAARCVAQRGQLAPAARRGARVTTAAAERRGQQRGRQRGKRRGWRRPTRYQCPGRLLSPPGSTILSVVLSTVATAATTATTAATAATSHGGTSPAVVLPAVTWRVGAVSPATSWRVRAVFVSPECRCRRDAGERPGGVWAVEPRSAATEHWPRHRGRSPVTIPTNADVPRRGDDAEPCPPDAVATGSRWRH